MGESNLNNLKKKCLWASLALISFVGVNKASFAEPAKLTVSASVGSVYDENPQKVSLDTEGRVANERKDSVGADLGLEYKSNSSDLDIGYRVKRDEFEKNSQDDETSYVGQSTYSLGNDATFYGLDASHQLTRKLNAPDAAEVNSNINEVSTISISPRVSTNPRHHTRAQLFGLYTDIDYEDNEIRLDTEQKGLQLTLDRKVTESKSVFLDFSASTTSFDGAEQLDYDYYRAGLGFTGNSNVFSYDVQVGSNTLSPKEGGDDETGTFFSGTLAYEVSHTDVKLSFRSELTASSIVGSLNDDATNGGLEGVSGEEDRVEFDDYEIVLNTQALCSRCGFSVGYSFQNVNNLTFSENDTEYKILSSSFSYSLNPVLRLNFAAENKDIIFVNDQSQNTESTKYKASLTGKISKSISLEVYAANEDFTGGQRMYDASLIGTKLNLVLY